MYDNKDLENHKKDLTIDEVAVADDVADGILQTEEKHGKFYFIFLLLLLVFLIFLVSSLSFALLGTFEKNVNTISTGSILFSYEENGNNISISNMYPTADNLGMNLSGDKEYFDFSVSAQVSENNKKRMITYEISLVPDVNNTLDSKYVRVNLSETSQNIIDKGTVSNFSDLPDSKIRVGAKVLYTKQIESSYSADYVFRMWLSDKYSLNSSRNTFKCYVTVDAY